MHMKRHAPVFVFLVSPINQHQENSEAKEEEYHKNAGEETKCHTIVSLFAPCSEYTIMRAIVSFCGCTLHHI